MSLPFLARLRSPLAYPGSQPGFDPTHLAAPGTTFSGVPSGANFVNLFTGAPGTITSSGTQELYGGLGPGVLNGSIKFANAAPTDTQPTLTLAGICVFIGSSSYPTLISTSNWALQAKSGKFGCSNPGPNYTINVTYTTGVPYFWATSINNNTSEAFVVVTDLNTGQIYSGTIAITPYTSTGDGYVYLNGSTLGITTGPAMVSSQFMSLDALLYWAADPWAFWYPRTMEKLLFVSLRSPTSGSAFILSLGNSSYSFTGDLSYSTITASDAAGSYALTGDTATPAVGLLSSSGSYATTGSLINAVLTLLLTAGAYAFSGVAAILFSSGALALALAAGAYALTGTASSLLIAILLAVIAGSYASAGALIYTMITALAAAGSYALTGAAATLLNAIRLAMIAGSYASAGASIVGRITMQILSGAYAIVGDLVDLTISIGTTTILLFATAGSYILSIPVVQRYFPVIPTFIRKIAPSLSQVRQSSPTLDKLDV